MADDDARFYWCLTHERVERGVGCRAQDRLGPYPTEEAARDWRSTHEARQDRWEAEDEEWESWGEDEDGGPDDGGGG